MMSSARLRWWYVIHKWTSLVCTVFLLVLCLTGLPIVFHEELGLWLGDIVNPPPQSGPMTRANLDNIVQDAQSRRPHDAMKFLMQKEDTPVWFVIFGKTSQSIEHSAIYQYDSRSGAFLHDVPVQEGLLHILLTLHVELFAGLPGMLFLGAMGLLFVASVISGVVIYGPFMRKLPFGTVRQQGSRRLTWLDLHNLLGIVTVVWVLVVGATGVVNTLTRPLLSLWQITELAAMIEPWREKPALATVASLHQASEVARAAERNMEIDIIALPGTPFAGEHHFAFFMRGTSSVTSRLLKPVLVEADTSDLTDSRSFPWYLTFLLLSQPLHFGDYGGLPLKILWAVLDIITIVVLMSGLYLWWKKRRMSVEQLLAEATPAESQVFSPITHIVRQ